MNNTTPTKIQKEGTTISNIERACCRSVSIDSTEHIDALAKCNPQYQSPLFATLPREIRELIWTFATAPVEDESKRYAENEYYCRPGHRAPHKTHTALLYTCRRIWLEANALPMLQAEHCFWYYRAAPDSRNAAWMANLTEANRRNFGQLHLFAQMFAVEGLTDKPGRLRKWFLDAPEQAGDFQPRVMHVTIRHTDWWYWENEAPLRFEDRWFQAMLDSPDLRSTQTLRLELETLDYKVEQLRPIVERLKGLESREYETHVVDGASVKTKFVLAGDPAVYTWTGPADINGGRYSPYAGKETLNYHVETLTWRLHFPSLPRAHIPTLRLAPRHPGTTPRRSRQEEDRHPLRPFEAQFHHSAYQPSDTRQIRRNRKAGGRVLKSKRNEDTYWWFAWQRRQNYVRAMDKWAGDVRVMGEAERFQEQVEGMRRADWEGRWRGSASLLRFA